MSAPAPYPFDAPAVERGVGFFETMLLVGRRAVLWQQHIARLCGTLARFDLPAPPQELLEETAGRLVEEAALAAGVERGLRFAWMAVGADLEKPESWRLDAVVRAIPATTLARRSGSQAVTLTSELRRDTPTVKSTSYFSAIAGLRYARRSGGDEGLFTNAEGFYLEGTSTALVAWGGGNPFLSNGGALPGVNAREFMRKRERNEPIAEADIRSGALLFGSLTKAVPIVSLDGRPCEGPPAMREQAAEFNEMLVTEPSWGRGF